MTASKLVPIRFNKEDQESLNEVINYLGLSNTFGEIPKSVKFCITFYLKWLKYPGKVIHTLNSEELGFVVSSIKKFQDQKKAEILLKEADKLV